MSNTVVQDANAVRKNIINQLGASGDIDNLMLSVDVALATKNVYAKGADVLRADVSKRKEQIRTDIEKALGYFQAEHKDFLIGNVTQGTPPEGTSIQDIVNRYADAVIAADADPEKKVAGNYLYKQLLEADREMKVNIERGIAEANHANERAATSGAHNQALEAARVQARQEGHTQGAQATRDARGPAERLGEKVDQRVERARNMNRREWLATLGKGGAGVGGVVLAGLLVQQNCGKKPAIVTTPPAEPATTPKPLPINFKKIDSTVKIKGGVTGEEKEEKNSVIITERAGNKLVFTGKNSHMLNSSELFSENATTEIHVLDATQHSDSIVIDTPTYARTDRQQKGWNYGSREKDRVKTDLCLHPSVLANYVVSADSMLNDKGDTSQDVILSFDPKPGVGIANLTPFNMVIKGHGVDAGGVHNDKTHDQAGIDQIKLVDSRGQVVKAVDVAKLSTSREFTQALGILQVEAMRSNDAPTPMSIENNDNLVHYAGRRFQDLSQSMGEGRSTRRTPKGNAR